MQHISAVELAEWLAAADLSGGESPPPTLLDVREPWEYALCHLADAVLIPMRALPDRLAELEGEAAIVVICHHGVRSLQAGAFLERQGFASLYNLSGGIDSWAQTVDLTMSQY